MWVLEVRLRIELRDVEAGLGWDDAKQRLVSIAWCGAALSRRQHNSSAFIISLTHYINADCLGICNCAKGQGEKCIAIVKFYIY